MQEWTAEVLVTRQVISIMYGRPSQIFLTKLHSTSCRKFVKHPMDLETIDTKLEEGEYGDPGEFASDMRLMFKNCHTYNMPGDDVVIMADKLRVRRGSIEKLMIRIK